MTRIPIEDTIQLKIVKSVEVEVVNFTLNTSAVCNVNYLNVSVTKISSVLFNVDGDDFNVNWAKYDNLISIA